MGNPIEIPDYDEDGTPDEHDNDDDNDGIPDVFEYEYLGSHKGPWLKNVDDKRDLLCPRIKANLTCGESKLRAKSFWKGLEMVSLWTINFGIFE